MYSFPDLEPVCCSMSSSNCCFLTCIPISQEAGQVVWYSHLFQNCPQFVVIHTVKGFGIVNKAEVDVFLELSCLFNNPVDVGNLISGSSAFSISSICMCVKKYKVYSEASLATYAVYHPRSSLLSILFPPVSISFWFLLCFCTYKRKSSLDFSISIMSFTFINWTFTMRVTVFSPIYLIIYLYQF